MELHVQELLEEVLKELSPDEEERGLVDSIVEVFTKRISEVCRRLGVKARPEVQGSIAKDTWIKGDKDIDIFIIFPPDTPIDEVKRVGLEVARASAGDRYLECYAEHPYVRALVDSYMVDIVPCLEISGEVSRPLTAVDRTPLHTRFVKSRLNEKLRNNIRLLKGFMKGIGAYGAEIKVSGFSGYLCELLVLYYGSFLDVVHEASNWRPYSTVIDIASHYEDPSRALEVFKSPLVVVDPVDKNRNVAAALSLEKLSTFILACQLFMLKPSKVFFGLGVERKEAAKLDIKSYIEKSGTALLAIATDLEPSPPDILWGQIKRSSQGLAKLLERGGFKVLRYTAWCDERLESLEENREVVFLFEIERDEVPPTIKHVGPPVTSRHNTLKFLSKHVSSSSTVAGPFIEGDRLVVLVAKRVSEAPALIRTEYPNADISKAVISAFKRRLDIALNEDIVDICKRGVEDFRKSLSSFLKGAPEWLIECFR
ncbi:MAG: CCA tRNA nucleotidyltransferase [Thermoprotei archaeon]|nr:MAG: CCA tRNA nucleotidyltransferase [Thermoprotei archaeon]RLF22254.1 MAG: CCA tRNA nucleotidyltransferase [Thermoprotei archaeon]